MGGEPSPHGNMVRVQAPGHFSMNQLLRESLPAKEEALNAAGIPMRFQNSQNQRPPLVVFSPGRDGVIII